MQESSRSAGKGRRGGRMAGGLAALALLAATAAFLLLRPGGGARPGLGLPDDCPSGIPGDCLNLTEAQAEEALARRYAPVLYLRQQAAPCDRAGAGFEPVPVDIVLGNPEVVLRQASDGSVIKRAPTAEDLFSEREGAFLDLPGNPRRPGCRFEEDGRRFAAGHPSVAYAHVARQGGEDRLALQYWFFYYFNDWNNKHEGDWEMVQVVFEAKTAREALTVLPVSLAYAQHGGGETAPWAADKRLLEGVRPIVYVAVGSQASFYRSHVFLGRAEQGSGFGCDDASPPSRRIDPEVRLVPSEVHDLSHPHAWLAFRGRWGELVGPDFDGPTGPNMKWQWAAPISWQDGLRSASVRIPSRESIGPDALDAFCDLIAIGSHYILPVIIALPFVALGAMGLFLAGVAVSLTRTAYLPVQARPLRARRRTGQLLLSAMEIYRRRARLFLGIGLTFVPVGLVTAGLQWLALEVSPLGRIVSVGASSPAERAALALALAEAEFGAAYAVVIAAATAALAAVEVGRATGVRSAFGEVLRRLPHLVLPRLLAVAAVVGLSVTIVGIPLAVFLAVRWAFIEQAVLLDGARGPAAMLRSWRTVGADWRWSAAILVGLGLLGLAAAPAFGIALLLAFRSLPLFWVSIASSLVYVAFVPYVAIALALAYFDLRQRAEAPPVEGVMPQ